ncbi:PilW family protein [Acinetobacter shaoyimingii]|uniref:Pilus assembly protein PilW n=1 Tax=Acinetobacter shaoyimingii TaxID=2715164 RepID=A0A6G8RYT3_9GAMM|nr:PilW family protein [Acinetobacter shaoyimingii]QIO07025.1 pilus assembly protein PilW [Acinetobacter shaoyimingii]
MKIKIINIKNTQGFTLVELLVALGLGIIISAAALQLFMGGLISTRMQQASAELQDSGLFGLEYIARDVRLVNFGNITRPNLNDETTSGGIVLSRSTTDGNFNVISSAVGDDDITKSDLPSNVNIKSDQLTIQFIAPNDMVNCEGQLVEKDQYVIQRYFLRPDANGQANDLALACDANKPNGTTAASIENFGGDDQGEIIMPRVDHLKFYLGAQSNKGENLGYYTIPKYIEVANNARSASNEPPRIVSVKIEVIVRSKDSTASKMVDPSVGTEATDDSNLSSTDSKTPYLRRLYVTTVALRNALGETL